MKNIFLLTLFITLVSSNLALYAQDSPDDVILGELIRTKAKELEIESMCIKMYSSDKEYIHLIQLFDKNGNTIEFIQPFGNQIFRKKYKYDSLGRTTSFTYYNIEDSSKIDFEIKNYYIDSTKYIQEYYNNTGKLTRTTTSTRSVDEQGREWYEDIRLYVDNQRKEKNLSRFTHIGDTLLISEYVKYDKEEKMNDIETTYQLIRKDSLGNLIKTSGDYLLKEEFWNQFHITPELLKDYYQNKEKYIQHQLDGKYAYEYGEDIHSYKIINSKNLLIQDGYGIYKKIFEYNSQNKLIKKVQYGTSEIKIGAQDEIVTHYKYYTNGLPKSITEQNLKSGKINEYIYTYKLRIGKKIHTTNSLDTIPVIKLKEEFVPSLSQQKMSFSLKISNEDSLYITKNNYLFLGSRHGYKKVNLNLTKIEINQLGLGLRKKTNSFHYEIDSLGTQRPFLICYWGGFGKTGLSIVDLESISIVFKGIINYKTNEDNMFRKVILHKNGYLFLYENPIGVAHNLLNYYDCEIHNRSIFKFRKNFFVKEN